MDNFATDSQPKNPNYIGWKHNCTPNGFYNSCDSCSEMTKYYKNLLRPANDEELPWTGMMFGLTVTAVWYWCSDQVIIKFN